MKKTEAVWPEIEQAYALVHQAAHMLTNHDDEKGQVVRGPVRVLTALALRRQCFLPRALAFSDPKAWYSMREQLTFRREARRKQLRFRKDPAAYLAALEEILLKTGLPS